MDVNAGQRSGGLDLPAQHIADAAHRANDLGWFGGVADFFTQACNLDVDGTIINIELALPSRVSSNRSRPSTRLAGLQPSTRSAV
ncbi:MAG: hypothetical protein R3F38_08540 [Gammaproteobacteria bacterium]